MPLTKKGQRILDSMRDTYGSEEKAKSVFHASKNKGTISGVDHGKRPITISGDFDQATIKRGAPAASGADYGTSEGAKKAAQTRASGGGGASSGPPRRWSPHTASAKKAWSWAGQAFSPERTAEIMAGTAPPKKRPSTDQAPSVTKPSAGVPAAAGHRKSMDNKGCDQTLAERREGNHQGHPGNGDQLSNMGAKRAPQFDNRPRAAGNRWTGKVV